MTGFECPLCQLPLKLEGRSLLCDNRHTFDLAKQGYVNLLPVQNKKSKLPGDPPESLDARRRWLSTGGYQPLADHLCALIDRLNPVNLLDAGCAEGYYTRQVGAGRACIGVDIAKQAIKMASSVDPVSSYAVASCRALPIGAQSMDCVLSVFAPIFPKEFARVLVSGGFLVAVVPAQNHLLELRARLFEALNDHSVDKHIELLSSYFELVSEERVSYELALDADKLKALLTMTPFAWRAPVDKVNSVLALDFLKVQVDFCVLVLRKCSG